MGHELALSNLPSPSDLGSYTRRVFQFPELSESEEFALATRLREDNDLEAAWHLVTSHLRYVVFIARGYAGYGLQQDDLIQEGNIGLMKAVKRFDPSRGVRLAAYAAYSIKAQIHDFIIANWSLVKAVTTKAKRKLFFKLRSTKERLGWLNEQETNAIAETLEVKPSEVREMESVMYQPDQSFEGEDDELPSPSSTMADYRFAPEQLLIGADFHSSASEALANAILTLDERSQAIIQARWIDEEKATLTDLAGTYGVSAERIRQIENQAIKKLKVAMTEEFADEMIA
ncbi:MAG: RNA polymerase sigma factor RpoH [Gammaproteobacteria bacterium]